MKPTAEEERADDRRYFVASFLIVLGFTVAALFWRAAEKVVGAR